MAEKPKTTTFGLSIWIAFALFILAAIGLPSAIIALFSDRMLTETKLTIGQIAVSLVSTGGAICVFAFAFLQYRRGEQWKRLEFVAREIKEFESEPTVQNALLMIDWGDRQINLHLIPNPEEKDLVKITREIQWKALLPHTVKRKFPEYRDPECTKEARFSSIEAKIRDTYDTFLTRLDRFATFINSDLITAEEVEPFINYWVQEMTSNWNASEDAAWRCTMLTYINFYGYSGVSYLLKCYGRDIVPGSEVYDAINASVPDRVLARRLLESLVREDHTPTN